MTQWGGWSTDGGLFLDFITPKFLQVKLHDLREKIQEISEKVCVCGLVLAT